MTPDEINTAIAQSLDWTGVAKTINNGLMGFAPYHPEWDESQWMAVPRYDTDLNAMHEVEKTLTDKEYANYAYKLCTLQPGRCNPAEQRAETYLKVKGLWK